MDTHLLVDPPDVRCTNGHYVATKSCGLVEEEPVPRRNGTWLYPATTFKLPAIKEALPFKDHAPLFFGQIRMVTLGAAPRVATPTGPCCYACGAEAYPDAPFGLEPFTGPALGPYSSAPRTGHFHVCTSCLADHDALRTLLRVLYERHGTGCCLHVVVDDHNVDDSSVDFCLGWAKEHGHSFCELLAQRLRALPEHERRFVLNVPSDPLDE